MSLFYKLAVAVLVAGTVVITYDLFQGAIERGGGRPRIRFDPATGRLTFRKPDISVRIVYASMFGPGEPVMRVRDVLISRFEEEYSDILARQRSVAVPESEKAPFVAETLRRCGGVLRNARRTLRRIDRLADAGKKRQQIEELASWLESHDILLIPLDARAGPEVKLKALKDMVSSLEALAAEPNPAEKVDVLPRLVVVERRWQGRWTLTANRPRFLTGREVPDIIGGSKMELFALVQDDYAVPLNVPRPGERVSPLDGPDTYGDPHPDPKKKRRWRDAFIPLMLAEGKYTFLADKKRANLVYLVPLRSTTFCIFYNEVLFEKAGVKPPRTWPEFVEVCRRLKSQGIAPLTADAEVYCDNWQTWLVFRALGQEAWEATITGVPADKPIQQRRSSPPWTDPRYKEIYSAIRELRASGFFEKGFRGSKWPAAQRGFAKGDAAMMICGTWLYQELGGYKDIASQDVFKLNCFTFPSWPAKPGLSPAEKAEHETRQKAFWVGASGLMVCRQGKATAHAIELLKYLTARDHPYLVHKNGLISSMKDADFPPSLKSIEAAYRTTPAVYSRSPNIYARRFGSQALSPLHRDFFMAQAGEKGFLTVDEFLRKMQAKTEEYLRNGGEGFYE